MTLFLELLILLAVLAEAGRLIIALVRPTPRYELGKTDLGDLAPTELLARLSAALDTPQTACCSFEGMTVGEEFYDAAVRAIEDASSTVHLTAYIYTPGKAADRFTKALAERARAGVEVRVLLDAFGSLTTREKDLEELTRAGGQLRWYHPLRWHTWPRMNHRTHQEIIVIDGKVGFVGGPGIADYWLEPGRRRRPWRDSMFRVTGGVVHGLQTAFAENWLESDGRLLAGAKHYPEPCDGGGAAALVVNSSPTRGGSARARILFQILIHSANRSIDITTPYFLPDSHARRELVRAMRERGVAIRVLVPGRHSVPFFTRRCSRRHYGELLAAGAEIYEYQPAMMHAKTMTVDGRWSVVGSTNFDPRSFGINDELNLAVLDDAIAAQLRTDFERDLESCERIGYEQWRGRPWWERGTELLSAVFERQQ